MFFTEHEETKKRRNKHRAEKLRVFVPSCSIKMCPKLVPSAFSARVAQKSFQTDSIEGAHTKISAPHEKIQARFFHAGPPQHKRGEPPAQLRTHITKYFLQ